MRLLHGYNQKIIETPTYIEIWEYEQLILTKRKTDNDEKKEKPDWLKTTKQTFDDLTAQGQYDSLKRKQKHYKNQRFVVARLIDMNLDNQTKFLTLTFKKNITDSTQNIGLILNKIIDIIEFVIIAIEIGAIV